MSFFNSQFYLDVTYVRNCCWHEILLHKFRACKLSPSNLCLQSQRWTWCCFDVRGISWSSQSLHCIYAGIPRKAGDLTFQHLQNCLCAIWQIWHGTVSVCKFRVLVTEKSFVIQVNDSESECPGSPNFKLNFIKPSSFCALRSAIHSFESRWQYGEDCGHVHQIRRGWGDRASVDCIPLS